MNTEYSDLITGCRTNGNEVLSRYPLVTVHSAHSNLAKIHSRLPVAMEFYSAKIIDGNIRRLYNRDN